MKKIPEQVLSLITRAKKRSLLMADERWARVNPQLSMVARVFVNRLENECVLPRLMDAADVDDLKAVLLVDYFLSLTSHREHRAAAMSAPLAVRPRHVPTGRTPRNGPR